MKFKVGDLVTWTADDDVGIVTDVISPKDSGIDEEPYWIRWTKEPTASGWHAAHTCLILLNSA
tara:strand:- start:1004 stop:1192 length:189 start_codon:yes stop_codon:yes gene_type:complete